MFDRKPRRVFVLAFGAALALGAARAAAAPAPAPVVVSLTFDDAISDAISDDNPETELDDVAALATSLMTDRDGARGETACPNVGAVGDAPRPDEALDCDVPGTFYVNSPRLDEPRYLTVADVQSFDAWGHEIGGHSAHHLDIPKLESVSPDTLDLAEQRLQICWDRRRLSVIPKLDGSGTLEIMSFSYPFGSFRFTGNSALIERFGPPEPELTLEQTREIAGKTNPGECAYRSGRLTAGVGNAPECLDLDPATPCAWAESTIPADPFALRAPDSVQAGTLLDYPVVPPNDDGDGVYSRAEELEARAHTIKGWIDNAALSLPAEGRNWIILTFHSICFNTECTKYGIEYHDFRELIGWLRQKRKAGEIEILPVHEVLEHTAEYRVTVPPIPAPLTRVQNADLTADINRDYVPDCFQVNGGGLIDDETAALSNTPHADADNDGDGSVNDGAGGDRWYGWLTLRTGVARARYLTRLDSGHCAPSVTGGNQYRLEFQYRTPSGPRPCPFFDQPMSAPCPITAGRSPSGEPARAFLIHAFRRPMGDGAVDEDGHWLGFTQVPLAEPSSAWQRGEAIVAADPDANAVSFGLEMRHNGGGDVQLDVDAFSYCRLTDDPADPVPACP